MARAATWCGAASRSRTCLPPSRFRDDNRRSSRPGPYMTPSRCLLMGGALFVILAAALATYFGLGPYLSIESRAKEGRKAAKGPPAVPVTVATVPKETVSVRLTAIGNV